MNISKAQDMVWQGLSQQLLAKYAKELGVSEVALNSFFQILDAQQVPLKDLDSKLHEIADSFQVLMLRLEATYSEDPQVMQLKHQARQAIVVSCAYAQAEQLLKQAAACDLYASEQVKEAAHQHRLSAAATYADNAQLQRVQLGYAQAAEYFKQAAAVLPLDQQYQQERADYLGKAGYDFHRAGRYSAALAHYEQSLAIRRELDQEQNELSKADSSIRRTVQLDGKIGLPDLAEDREALERLRAQLQGL